MNTKPCNPVLDFINTLCSFVVLNLVFLLTCLPVITIGAALTALYSVTEKEADGAYGYMVRTYLREFKKNFTSSTIAFLLLFLSGALLLFNVVFWYSLDSIWGTVVTAVLFLASILWFLTLSYTFPLLARFENSVKQTLQNALCISLCNGKSTLFLLLIDALALFFCLFLPPAKILMVLFGFAFLAYCQSFLFLKVFKPYEDTTTN